MQEQNKDVCSGGSTLIFACSGAADVGEIADLAARQMTKEGLGKMFCTAGLGGRIGPIMKTTQAAGTILALDGCGLDCVKKGLELAGFTEFVHMRVTDMDMEKGKTPANEENIDTVVKKGKELLS